MDQQYRGGGKHNDKRRQRQDHSINAWNPELSGKEKCFQIATTNG